MCGMRRLTRAALPALAAMVAAMLVAAPIASAAPPQAAFGLRAVGNFQAGYFVYQAKAGAVRHGAIVVSNSGTAKGTVRLSTADATTGATTGTVYLSGRAPRNAGTWVSLDRRDLTLAPGAQAQVSFTVHVPAGARSGEHVAGIVAEATDLQTGGSRSGKTSVRIRIRNLSIMAVQVDVPGPAVHRLAIGRAVPGGSHGSQQVIVHVANTGNVLEKPKGVVSIHDAKGKVVETLRFAMDTFLPHTAIDYPIALRRPLPQGAYWAAVELRYAAGAPTGPRTAHAAPTFAISRQDVQRVFTSTSPTLPAPVASSQDGGPISSVSTGDHSSPWLWVALGAALALLGIVAGAVLVLARRRGGGGGGAVTIPDPPAPAVQAEPEAAVPEVSQPETAPEMTPETVPERVPAACEPDHYWSVRYDDAVEGADGVWRFPHRCRTCGVELLARDVADASEQAVAGR
jgi:hypothetical protein